VQDQRDKGNKHPKHDLSWGSLGHLQKEVVRREWEEGSERQVTVRRNEVRGQESQDAEGEKRREEEEEEATVCVDGRSSYKDDDGSEHYLSEHFLQLPPPTE
jgi:hypothetical protein